MFGIRKPFQKQRQMESLAARAPEVLQKYFQNSPTFLTSHHINTFEKCVLDEIPEMIFSENPIVVLKEPLDAEKGIYKYRTEIFIGGDVSTPEELALDVGAPIVTLDDGKTVRRMFPNEARIRNLTYAAQYRADILIRLTFTAEDETGTYKSIVRELPPIQGFPLFRIPILLRSKLCATDEASSEMRTEMGECRNDPGGYFIVDGSEKVLITRQKQAVNSLYVAKKSEKDPKLATFAQVDCQHPVSKQVRRVALYRLRGTRTVEDGVIRVSIPFVKGTIPLFVLFRALGVESDEEIVRMILPTENAAAEATLIASIHDAWPVTTQGHAIEFIRTLTKEFIPEHVLNIMRTYLFAHVPDRPLARAYYLAEIVRKMIRVEMGQEPGTNRDDIRTQRLMPAGILLRGLFGECWKMWKKSVIHAVDIQYNYNRSMYQDENFLQLFSLSNLPRILATATLNDSIMRGFRGKWGTNQYNMEVGVIQPLARISYMDSVSHTRRIVSDFDVSMKLVGPRQLHTSQVGYFCTSETPTGAHIGATKNYSILTTVSVAAHMEPVMNWMLERGGVVEVALAPRAMTQTAVSVQINGGTIGFTQRPELLVLVLKLMKWTGCLYPHVSISFNTSDSIVRIYMDDGRPLRPLWHLNGGEWPPMASQATMPSWRNLLMGTFPATQHLDVTSTEFVDPLASAASPTLQDYIDLLTPHMGGIEYMDPYEGNEAYVSWWGNKADLTQQHTHAEVHPSSLMGAMASMIPYAPHNQSPRNQLSCSQSKQGIGYYATNYENRFDTYGSMLCYGEGAICRTIYHDAIAGGEMPYGTNIIFAINSFNGYNQDDGILFNRSSIERGLFRSLALRSYETGEEEEQKVVYRIGNPKFVLSWTDLKPGNDYSGLDDQGIIREGTVIHDKTVLVGRYLTLKDTGAIKDASLLPTVFTKGRVDKVVILHQANGMKLVKVRILEERVPELGDKYCLDDSHDVLTTRGWVNIRDVTVEDKVAQLNKETSNLEYVHPLETMVFDHEGQMYEVETQGVSQCVTLNHRMWVQKRNATNYELIEAKQIYGKRVKFQSGNSPIEGDDKAIEINDIKYEGEYANSIIQIIGIFFAEGWTYISDKDSICRVEFAANKPRVQEVLKNCCDMLDFKYSFSVKTFKFYINNKNLATYLSQYNTGSTKKHLPDWAFSLSAQQSKLLLESMCLGDGHESATALIYHTSSEKLRDDVQILAQHAGWTAYYAERYPPESTFVLQGRIIISTVSAWTIGIRRSRLYPTLNHGHTKHQNGQTENIIDFKGKVYCLRVPSEVFLVRRNGRCSFTGNSTRHGQKGTMGMLMDAVDMPRTPNGLVPDVMVNPHCIPSRMTMAQMLEQLFGRLGAEVGAKINATSFMNDDQSLKAMGDVLEMMGLHRTGEEVMYSGITGKMFSSSVFMGPMHFMRLKHLAQDKMNARGAGRREVRTHQPTGGRGNEGGMRIGEMERDVLLAHGITDFLQESMMKRSDGTSFWICNGCGTIPVVNEAEGLFVCPACDGPIQYQGVTAETIGLVLPVEKSRATFSKVEMPYALKLLDQELQTFMNAGFRFVTTKVARGFREPTPASVMAEVAKEAEEGLFQQVIGLIAPAPASAPVAQLPTEEGSADMEDEGQPARNEGVVVEAVPGQATIDVDAKGSYKEFATGYPIKLEVAGKTWPSAEHYFQAMKFSAHPDYQETIRAAKTAATAKKLGKTTDIPAQADWLKYRDEVMLDILRIKFAKDPLKSKLLETGDALIRDTSPQDNYWGIGRSGRGTNKLGKLLMQVRQELKDTKAVNAVAEVAAATVRIAQNPTESVIETANNALLEPIVEIQEPFVAAMDALPVSEAVSEPASEPAAPEQTSEQTSEQSLKGDENVKVIKL